MDLNRRQYFKEGLQAGPLRHKRDGMAHSVQMFGSTQVTFLPGLFPFFIVPDQLPS